MRSVVYFSDATFKQNQYGESSVKRASKFFTQQTDNFKPSWLFGQVVTNLLIDEAELIQYGQEEETTFHSFKLPAPLPSSWLTYPTQENPSSKYKFSSIEVNFTLD